MVLRAFLKIFAGGSFCNMAPILVTTTKGFLEVQKTICDNVSMRLATMVLLGETLS